MQNVERNLLLLVIRSALALDLPLRELNCSLLFGVVTGAWYRSAMAAVFSHGQNASSGVRQPAINSPSAALRSPTGIRAGAVAVLPVYSGTWSRGRTPWNEDEAASVR